MPTIRLLDREADYTKLERFWYDIYCVGRGVLLDKADHDLKLLPDPLVGGSNAFVAEDVDGVCGSVVTTYSSDADIEEYERFYEMCRVPQHPHTTSITRKLMVSRRYRGSRLGVALACATFELALSDGITHNFIDCNRPLHSFFQKLGFQNHSDWKVHADFGEVRVMLLRLAEDQEYFHRIGSPFARKHASEANHVAL